MKTINLKYIESLNPCEDGLDNYIEHHSGFEGAALEFIELDNIPISDKQWLLLSNDFLSDRQLHLYACFCAERVLHIYEEKYPNDDRLRKAIEAKRLWLDGKITDKELTAAWAAARDAAGSAARSVWDAAMDAARAAAWTAARDARDAAMDAAWSAARSAVWSVAWDAAWAAAWAAARDAAMDAARVAEEKQQLKELKRLLKEIE